MGMEVGVMLDLNDCEVSIRLKMTPSEAYWLVKATPVLTAYSARIIDRTCRRFIPTARSRPIS